MSSFKKDIRQLFRSLEARIDELTNISNPADPTPAAQLSDQVERSLHIASDRATSSLSGDIGIREISISIPGISSSRAATRPLIAPISEIEPVPESPPAKVSTDSSNSNDLVLALQAPLVALGLVDAGVLTGYEWAQPWVALAASDSIRENIDVFAEYLGPWFGRSVVAKASSPIVRSNLYKAVVEPYILPAAELPQIVGWNVLAATLDVLASRSESHRVHDVGSMLTLTTQIISSSVTNGLADPRRYLQSIASESTAARGRWTEYLQTVCSLPERLANRVDPQDIPQ
ncbi:hypothetical protein LPJ53_004288, partial [Coemansia erecta]